MKKPESATVDVETEQQPTPQSRCYTVQLNLHSVEPSELHRTMVLLLQSVCIGILETDDGFIPVGLLTAKNGAFAQISVQ